MTIEQIQTENNISKIAEFIKNDWPKINIYANEYLKAMLKINSINDNYYDDTAREVVLYFLSNSRSYRGENAKIVKARLNQLIKDS